MWTSRAEAIVFVDGENDSLRLAFMRDDYSVLIFHNTAKNLSKMQPRLGISYHSLHP